MNYSLQYYGSAAPDAFCTFIEASGGSVTATAGVDDETDYTTVWFWGDEAVVAQLKRNYPDNVNIFFIHAD